jgi:adenylate cyclase
MLGDVESPPPGDPTAAEVLEQLARILESPEFSAPERARSFLRYIVEETIAGRSERIKAFSIALEVFGRDKKFDAQNDPIVRIEAGRLRRALERYYLVAGQADPVLIVIPKGAYVPHFSYTTESQSRDPDQPPSSQPPVLSVSQTRQQEEGDSPKVLVALFKDAGDGPEAKLYAVGICEELINALSRFNEVMVLGPRTSLSLGADPEPDKVGELGARYLVDGSVRIAGNHVRVTARVADALSSQILWSQAFDDDLSVHDLIEIQERIASEIATIVARPYGVVFQADARHLKESRPQDVVTYFCTLRAYQYRHRPSPEGHERVRKCLEATLPQSPGYATARAMLAYVYLDEIRYGFNPRPRAPSPIDRALDAARQALEIEPENVRAMQAYMLALFLSGDVAEALRVGERAIAHNPNDPEILAEFGTRVALAGDWQRGRALLEKALARDPGGSNFYSVSLAFVAYMQGDMDAALAEIRRADRLDLPLSHLVAAVVYAEAGLTHEAKVARDRYLGERPTFFDALDAEMEFRQISPDDQRRFLRGVLKAGFPVPMRLAGKLVADGSH